MPDIFPAHDQSVGEVMTDLTAMGFRDGPDFRLHYTWDARPHVQASDEVYERWAAERGDTGTAEATKDGSDTEESTTDESRDESSDDEDSGTGTRARRAGTKRR